MTLVHVFKLFPILMVIFFSCARSLPAASKEDAILQEYEGLLFRSDTSHRVEVPHDKALMLDCLVNEAATDVIVTWTKDGYHLNCPRRCVFTNRGQQLLMSETSPFDDGSYKCEVTIKNKTAFRSFEVTIDYAVPTKPLLDSNSLGNHQVLLGSNFSLFCNVLNEDSKDGLRIQYFKTNTSKEECRAVPSDATNSIQDCSKRYCVGDGFVKDVKKLVFFNIKKADSGCFTCVARNRYGASSVSGFIDVVEETSMAIEESLWVRELVLAVLVVVFLAIIISSGLVLLFYCKFRRESERRKESCFLARQVLIWTKEVMEESSTCDEIAYPQATSEIAKTSKDLSSTEKFFCDLDPDLRTERYCLQLSDAIDEEVYNHGLLACTIGAKTGSDVEPVKMLKEDRIKHEVKDVVIEMELKKTNGSKVDVISFVVVYTKYDERALEVDFEDAGCANWKEFLLHHTNQKIPNHPRNPISVSPRLTIKSEKNKIDRNGSIDLSKQVGEGLQLLSSRKLTLLTDFAVCKKRACKVGYFGLTSDAKATIAHFWKAISEVDDS